MQIDLNNLIIKLLRFFIYRNQIVSKIFWTIFYAKWQKRLREKRGFIDRQNVREKIAKDLIIPFHNDSFIKISPPITVNSNSGFYYPEEPFHPFEREYIFVFENSNFVGLQAVGMTNDGDIILDTVLNRDWLLNKCSPRALENYAKIETEAELDLALSLVNIYSDNHSRNYFHWFLDSLIALEAVEFYEKRFSERPKLIVNRDLSAFQRDSLKHLDFEETDLFQWDHNRAQVKKMIVPMARKSKAKRFADFYSPHGILWFRDKFSDGSKTQSRERIYISRSKAKDRRVLNEEELLAFLKTLGFKVCHLEEMTFKEQAKLFSRAEVVVSPHGAGLTNVIFSHDVTVVELFDNLHGVTYWYDLYYKISLALYFRYAFLECEFENGPNRGEQSYNLIVNTKELDRLFKKLGL